jgi:hypothetical protein
MKNSITQKAKLIGFSLLLFSTTYSFAQGGRDNGGRNNGGGNNGGGSNGSRNNSGRENVQRGNGGPANGGGGRENVQRDNGGRDRNEHQDRNVQQGRNEQIERNDYRDRDEHRESHAYLAPRANYYERPRTSVSIGIGNGYGYGYSGAGAYYSPYSSHYISPRFALGFRFNLLPMGYLSMNWGGNPYYYYNGSFMRNYNNYYEIVEAPIGAEVPSLPIDARPVEINDIKYYEINGNFFKKVYHENGETWYRVVGKNGRLETEYDRD